MPNIQFSAKVRDVYNADGTLAFKIVKVPKITRAHCDMCAFREHRVFGAYANSDLFDNLISKSLKTAGIGEYIRLDRVPQGVAVDTSSFLARVTIALG